MSKAGAVFFAAECVLLAWSVAGVFLADAKWVWVGVTAVAALSAYEIWRKEFGGAK